MEITTTGCAAARKMEHVEPVNTLHADIAYHDSVEYGEDIDSDYLKKVIL